MRARWTAPDGRGRRGWIPVSPEWPAGRSAGVWVDNEGIVTQPPMQPGQLRGWVKTAEVAAPRVLALILFLVGREGRFLFARRRMAQWDDT